MGSEVAQAVRRLQGLIPRPDKNNLGTRLDTAAFTIILKCVWTCFLLKEANSVILTQLTGRTDPIMPTVSKFDWRITQF